MTDLAQLLARIEAATGPDREVDAAMWLTFVEKHMLGQKIDLDMIGRWPAYTASIDAIVALIERALPGWCPSVGQNVHHKDWLGYLHRVDEPNGDIETVYGRHPTVPALALCAAFVRAMMAQQQERQG